MSYAIYYEDPEGRTVATPFRAHGCDPAPDQLAHGHLRVRLTGQSPRKFPLEVWRTSIGGTYAIVSGSSFENPSSSAGIEDTVVAKVRETFPEVDQIIEFRPAESEFHMLYDSEDESAGELRDTDRYAKEGLALDATERVSPEHLEIGDTIVLPNASKDRATVRRVERGSNPDEKDQYEIVVDGDYGKTITIGVLDELNDEDRTVERVVVPPET